MTSSRRSTPLPAVLRSATVGRHFACDAVADWGLPELADDVALCTSELVTNAVLHAGTDLVLSLHHDGADRVLVEVWDGTPALNREPGPQLDPTADHGRGLQIVEALSSEWGVIARQDGGKAVWFALTRSAAGQGNAPVTSIRAHRGDEAPAAAARQPREARVAFPASLRIVS